MSKHLTEQEAELYRRRGIDTAQRQRLSAHLNACENCLQRVLDPEYSNVAFTALTEAFLPSVDEEPFHLSREELKNYLTGAIDEADRIVCESHLEICERCGEEARKLSAVGVQPVTIAGNAAPSRGKATSFKERFSSWWRLPGTWTPARVMGVIVLFGGLFVLGLIWYQSRTGSTVQQTAQTEPGKDENTSASQNNSTEVKPNEETTAAAVSPNTNAPQAEAVEGQGESPEKNSNSSIVVSLKDNGHEITLDGQGNLTGLDGLAPATRRTVKAVLASESLPKPQGLDGLSAPAITLMGQPAGGSSFRLAGPVGIVIVNDRPTLRWKRLDGATNYTVSLFDAEFNRIARSEPQAATEWRVSLPLRRGVTYSWEVTAIKDGQEITAPVAPAPRAQFKVLESERLEELSRLEKQRPVSNLTLGVMYARYGLLDEAEREFQRLLKENPRSPLARNLLRTVQSWKSR